MIESKMFCDRCHVEIQEDSFDFKLAEQKGLNNTAYKICLYPSIRIQNNNSGIWTDGHLCLSCFHYIINKHKTDWTMEI